MKKLILLMLIFSISLFSANDDIYLNEIFYINKKYWEPVYVKNMELTITGLRGFDEAIITKGGISIKEINPKTFESKRIKGLSFIGEVLDVDALTGGYNLQIAWSSAVMCARAQIDSTY